MSGSPASQAAAANVSGQPSGPSWSSYEADLGSEAAREGTFSLTDDLILLGSHILIMQAVGPYTGKGTLADEAQMDPIWAVAEPVEDGRATVYWKSLEGGLVIGNVRFDYLVTGPTSETALASVFVRVFEGGVVPVPGALVTVTRDFDGLVLDTAVMEADGSGTVQIPDATVYTLTATFNALTGSIADLTADASASVALDIPVN